MAAESFQQLEVWKKAHALVLSTYRLTTAKFPREELYGLTSQLRRSMVSVAANIAEGFTKRGKADKIRFYNISEGSLEESRYYLILSRDLGFADTNQMLVDIDEVGRMLRAYSNAISESRSIIPSIIVSFFSTLTFGIFSSSVS